MASKAELTPKQKSIEDISRSSVHLINRLRQAFPGFFDGYEVNGPLKIEFTESLINGSQPAITTVYQGTELTGVYVNKTLVHEMYEELDETFFTDLVRTNIGIAVCLDAVFQKLLRDFDDPRITEKVLGFLCDTSSVPNALCETLECESDERIAIADAWLSMITREHKIDEDLVVHINSRRLAFGMVLMAEEDKFGAVESNSVADSVRKSIAHQMRVKARTMRLVGYAMTQSLEKAVIGAAQSTLDPNILPFAIPYTVDDMNVLNRSMQKAARSFELPYSDELIIDLSGGYSQ